MEWLKKQVKETVESLIIAIILALIIRAFLVQAFSIPSGSMEPTLKPGDMLLANKLIYRIRNPQRGEIIIFKAPPTIEKREYFDLYLFKIPIPTNIQFKESFNFYFFHTSRPSFLYTWKDFIKRVIAVEGDIVEIKNGKVIVNSQILKEDYIKEKPDYLYGPKKVPPGYLFVLGDNRNNSADSHIWGFLPIKNVRGKALFIYWPPQHFGLIK